MALNFRPYCLYSLGDCFPWNVGGGGSWDQSDVTALIRYMAKSSYVRDGEGHWSDDFEFIQREMIPGGPGLSR